MPNLNVMTWNSRGECANKAMFLQNLILNNPVVPNWFPDVILIQEALANQGGAIWNMLSNLHLQLNGAIYSNVAPQFAAIPGESYIMKVSNNAAFAANFAAINLAADPGVQASLNAFSLQARMTAQNELNAMRYPAGARINSAGRTVNIMTWHAPLGPSAVLQGVNAKVNYLAYYFLQNSNYYTGTLLNPGVNNLSIIAGDLNVTAADLNNPTVVPAIPRLLPGWNGISNNLDHILTYGNLGVTFNNHGSYPTGLSDHEVLVSTVHWP